MQVFAEGSVLYIEGSEAIDKEHFKKNHLPNLETTLEKFGFNTFNCQVEKNDVDPRALEEAFHAENAQIVQAANEEALRYGITGADGTSSSAEEKPVFDFQAKKAAAKPKLDKAEITPMIEVTTGKLSGVFDGVVFDVEQKVTSRCRVLINFKMTDYTSSFSMQKWVKNEEEAQKFDHQEKNFWL